MSKAQIRREILNNIRTGLSLEEAANALVYEFEMYALAIRQVEIDMMAREMLTGAF